MNRRAWPNGKSMPAIHGPGQRQLKRREIGPLFQITGTENTSLKGTMQTADRLAPRWAARKVDTKNVHAFGAS
jgi:hypothetical protein